MEFGWGGRRQEEESGGASGVGSLELRQKGGGMRLTEKIYPTEAAMCMKESENRHNVR